MDTPAYNSFASNTGIAGSLISIGGFIALVRYRGHLPEARIIELQRLFDDVERLCRRDDVHVPSELQQRLSR